MPPLSDELEEEARALPQGSPLRHRSAGVRPLLIGEAVSSLTLDEGQNVGIDDIRVSRHQPVWETRIDFERGILEQFGLQ